jgi:hypothetical protein
MARRRSTSDETEKTRPEVVLVDSSENETTVHTTTAFNNLVYGQGYKPKSGTVEEAYMSLLEGAAEKSGEPVPMTPAE